ncbi:MAG: Gfo/Idh/MocA family protein [Bryobacteraceae bacterium]
MITKTLSLACLCAVTMAVSLPGQTTPSAPLRVGIVGLVHGHAGGFLGGGALVPAGAALHRPDVQVVGVAEPDRALFDRYAKRLGLHNDLYFSNLDEMISRAHPQAVLVFTNTFDHTDVVKQCARRGVHVMMEKPLAVSYRDALAIADAARSGKIHVLVDYETTWYASNKAAYDLLQGGGLGEPRKFVAHDGHDGPFHMQPEFVKWLSDPKLNGAGALFDFGCYGADLATWLMKGQAPVSVTAITKQMQPDRYPKVDDEADILVNYPSAVAVIQGSWDWPFSIKDLEVYGRTGYAKTIAASQVTVRREGDKAGQTSETKPLESPYDDPLHYMRAVLDGKVEDHGSPSSLDTNIIATEILDAARQSAQSGRTVRLPLSR